MKLLCFIAKKFYWKSYSKTLDQVDEQDFEETVHDAVIVFVHAEEHDPENAKLETKVTKFVKWLANKRELKRVVLHSFTHLSGSTAPPEYAKGLLDGVEARLTKAEYEVRQTAFGYFSEWDLSVYGESLAKVFKEF